MEPKRIRPAHLHRSLIAHFRLALLCIVLVGFILGLRLVANASSNRPTEDTADPPVCDKGPEANECIASLPFVLSLEWPQPWVLVGKKVADVEKFYSIAVCDDHMLAGSDLGIYSRTGNATDWKKEQTDVTRAITDVTFVPNNCNKAYAAVLGHGVYFGRHNNNEWDWQLVDTTGQLKDAETIVIVPGDGAEDAIYAGGAFGVFWLPQLPESPVTWQQTSIETATTSLIGGPKVLASVWTEGVSLLAGGATWLPLGTLEDKLVYQAVFDGSQGLAGTQTGAFIWKVNHWERSAAVQNTTFSVAMTEQMLITGRRTEGVMISQDRGATWFPAKQGLDGVGSTGFQVRDLLVYSVTDDKADHKVLYAATTTGIWKWTGQP